MSLRRARRPVRTTISRKLHRLTGSSRDVAARWIGGRRSERHGSGSKPRARLYRSTVVSRASSNEASSIRRLSPNGRKNMRTKSRPNSSRARTSRRMKVWLTRGWALTGQGILAIGVPRGILQGADDRQRGSSTKLREPMEILADLAIWSGVALCVPACFLLVEILAGLRRLRSLPANVTPLRAVLLIPAHNEAAGIALTLERLSGAGTLGMRVIVVADNCSDDTARIARESGVEVFERTSPMLRGKPHALEWALRLLDEDPPDVVVFMDADCWFHVGGPARLASQALTNMRPVQCIYLLEGQGLGAFAFRFRNEARLRGLQALGAPVQITGSGFAIPWEILRRVSVPLGELAEDAVWGWAFCRAGHGVGLAFDTVLGSAQPLSARDASVQRRRWEHGLLSAVSKQLPALVVSAFLPPRWRRILHLLDVLIPPLALLVILLTGSLTLGLTGGRPSAILPASIGFCMLAAAVMVGWSRYGRPYVPFSALLFAPVYATKKIGLYMAFLFRKERNWVRTRRSGEE